MKISPNVLTLDIKIQDKFRRMLADLDGGFPKLTGVMLGDSDVDYNFTQQPDARILNAPFNTGKIKYPILYKGGAKGLDGHITCFLRKVIPVPNSITVLGQTYNLPDSGRVDSLYGYSPSLAYTQGVAPPTLSNGFDWNTLDFSNDKMGYIVYFQTILYGYVDPATNLPMRLNEIIDIEVTFNGSTIVPPSWEITKDTGTRNVTINNVNVDVYHNSMLIGKDALAVAPQSSNNAGLITLKGKFSNITRQISFNI